MWIVRKIAWSYFAACHGLNSKQLFEGRRGLAVLPLFDGAPRCFADKRSHGFVIDPFAFHVIQELHAPNFP